MWRPLLSQDGQDMVEWAGVLLIVCAVIAVLVEAGLATAVAGGVRCEVTAVLSGESPHGACGSRAGSPGGGGARKVPAGGSSRGITAVATARIAAKARPKDCHKLRIVLSPSAPNVTCLGNYSTVGLQLTFRGSRGVLAWGEEMRYKILRAAQGGTVLAQWQVYENGRPMTGDGCVGGSVKDRQIYHSSGCTLTGGNYYTFEFNFYALNAKTHTIIDVTDITRFYVSSVGNAT